MGHFKFLGSLAALFSISQFQSREKIEPDDSVAEAG